MKIVKYTIQRPLILCCLLWMTSLNASQQPLTINQLEEGFIHYRSISSRCHQLNQIRERMLEKRQRYNILLARGDRLVQLAKNAKEHDYFMIDEMNDLHRRVRHQLHLIDQKIINREAHIIRAGCPTMRF